MVAIRFASSQRPIKINLQNENDTQVIRNDIFRFEDRLDLLFLTAAQRRVCSNVLRCPARFRPGHLLWPTSDSGRSILWPHHVDLHRILDLRPTRWFTIENRGNKKLTRSSFERVLFCRKRTIANFIDVLTCGIMNHCFQVCKLLHKSRNIIAWHS